MLKALELENFKAFGERTRIEFAPITLIFGENSAGKSSILQALNLLKQTRESREHGALLLPRVEGGFVDLGSFQELLFDHDLERDLVFRVEIDTQLHPRRSGRPVAGGESIIALEAAFCRPSEDSEVLLKHLRLLSTTVSDVIAHFEPVELARDEIQSIVRNSIPMRTSRPLRVSKLKAVKCTQVTEDLDYWARFYERAKRLTDRILEELGECRTDLEHSSQQRSLFHETEEERQACLAETRQAIEFYSSEFSLSAYVKRMREAELGTLVILDGFTPMPARPWNRPTLPEFTFFRRYAPQRIRREQLTVDVALAALDAGRYLDLALECMYPMGPYRRPPERWYIFTGTSPEDVGYRGDQLPDLLFRRSEILRRTNEWLQRLEIGYKLDVRSIGTRARDLFEVRLVDTRRAKAVDVALSDVGYGISQILPFVVQCLAGERQVITIEQPEVHIHPRLQADLGDLLAEAIREPQAHRFIVETHSEHLVLRMQRLIRGKKLRPDEVSVIYVSRGDNGSKLENLHLDEDGDFVDEWPGGFFPERLRELR